ncbi:MAG: pilus assembly protein PilP [Candidatus Binatia bacterium]
MRKFCAAFALFSILLFPVKGWSQEERQTPAQKTAEAAKAKLQAALEAKKSAEVEAAGKRDPFRPFVSETPKVRRRPRENLSPLERYAITQLKLVAVIWDIEEPRAMVEDTSGLGYIVKLGTPIGNNEGKVKAIRPNEIVIEESYTDFYGRTKSRKVKMKLASE